MKATKGIDTIDAARTSLIVVRQSPFVTGAAA